MPKERILSEVCCIGSLFIFGRSALKLCELCGNEITNKRRKHFCSNVCSHKYWDSVYEKERNTPGVRPYYTWSRIAFEINERDNRTCVKCGYFKEVDIYNSGVVVRKYRYLLEVHHKTPLSLGGSNLPENLETLCPECHKKSHPEGYRKTARRIKVNRQLISSS